MKYRGMKTWLKKSVAAYLATGFIAIVPGVGQAAPVHGGGVDTAGVDIKTYADGAITGITATAENNVVNWEKFNIGSGEAVQFDNNNYLNLIHDTKASEIYGGLYGGGSIYLINPNGILFGESAQVNVGSLHVSTRAIDGADWATYVDSTSKNIILGDTSKIHADIINMGKINADSVDVSGLNITFTNIDDNVKTADGSAALAADKATITAGGYAHFGKSLANKAGGGQYFGANDFTGAALAEDVDTDNKVSGDITKSKSYYMSVSNADELKSAMDWNCRRVMLAKDIDASSLDIGLSDYAGKIDGVGHTVKNLNTSFLKSIAGGVVENVKLEVGSISGEGNVGALAGTSDGAIVKNVHVLAKDADSLISATGDTVGGIIGQAASTTIEMSSNAVSVNGNGNVGGIVGKAEGSAVVLDKVSNSGKIVANYGGGGLVGAAYSGVTIKNSHNTGGFTGGKSGGLVGIINEKAESLIENSYNTGGTDDWYGVGGLVGLLNSTSPDGGAEVGTTSFPVEEAKLTIKNSYAAGAFNYKDGAGGFGAVIGVKNTNAKTADGQTYSVGELTSDDATELNKNISGVKFVNGWGAGIGSADSAENVASDIAALGHKDYAASPYQGDGAEGIGNKGTTPEAINPFPPSADFEGVVPVITPDTKPAEVTIAPSSTDKKTMNIDSSKDYNVLNWNLFNIGKDNTVDFHSKNYLNLIADNKASSILGTLKGDGSIYLINPNGVLFGDNATVNVGSLYVSTRALDKVNTANFDGTDDPLGTPVESVTGNFVNMGNIAADKLFVEANNITFKNADSKDSFDYKKTLYLEADNYAPSKHDASFNGVEFATKAHSSLSSRDGKTLNADKVTLKANNYVHIGKSADLMTADPADGVEYKSSVKNLDGTANADKYTLHKLVFKQDDLKQMQYENSNIMLGNDITLTEELPALANGAGGTYTKSFDGLGYTVSGLKNSTGLAAKAENASFVNVTFSGVAISGDDKVGSIVGEAGENVTINNVKVTGTVEATGAKGYNAGALVGMGTFTGEGNDITGVTVTKKTKPESGIVDPSKPELLPTDGVGVDVTISTVEKNSMTVVADETGNHLVNWQTFSIGDGNKVAFTGGNFLNIVKGNLSTEIYGILEADGSIYILNPNGIMIGDNANISVGSLGLSSREGDADMAAFMNDGKNPFGNVATGAKGNVTILSAAINLGDDSQITLEGNNITVKEADKVVASGKLVKAAGYIHYGSRDCAGTSESTIDGWASDEALGNLDGSKKELSVGNKNTENGYSFYKLVDSADEIFKINSQINGHQAEWKGLNLMFAGNNAITNTDPEGWGGAHVGDPDELDNFTNDKKSTATDHSENRNVYDIKIDGLGYEVTGLKTGLTWGPYCGTGMFRSLQQGTIENVKFTGVDVAPQGGKTGALVGTAKDVVIRNVYVEGKITSGISGTTDKGNFGKTGGIIGVANGTVVLDKVAANVDVTAYSGADAASGVGGLVGENAGTLIIKDSYAIGTVNGESSLGGLVGAGDATATTSYSGVKLPDGSFASSGVSDVSSVYTMTGTSKDYALDTYKTLGFDVSDKAESLGTWRIYDTVSAPMLVSLFKGNATAKTEGIQTGSKQYNGNEYGLKDVGVTVTYDKADAANYGGEVKHINAGTYTGNNVSSSQLGYNIVDNSTMTIDKKKITIGAMNHLSTHSTNVTDNKEIALNELVGTDEVLLDLNKVTATLDNTDIGDGHTVTYTGVTADALVGNNASNYELDGFGTDGKVVTEGNTITERDNPAEYLGDNEQALYNDVATMQAETSTNEEPAVVVVTTSSVATVAGEPGGVSVENGETMKIDPKQSVHDNRNGEKNGKEKKSKNNK